MRGVSNKHCLLTFFIFFENSKSITPRMLASRGTFSSLVITLGRHQSKTPILSRNVDKINRNSVFDCHLSTHLWQMAIENTCFYQFMIRIRRLRFRLPLSWCGSASIKWPSEPFWIKLNVEGRFHLTRKVFFTGVFFSFQKDRYFAGTDANTIQAYTFPAGNPDGILTRFTAPANHIVLNESGSTLVAGSR